jgi:hypothetical protein
LRDKSVSILSLIFITSLLLTGLSIIPVVQSQAPGRQPGVQPNSSIVNQINKLVAEKVAAANPGVNATLVEQLLTELTRQTAATSSSDSVLQEAQHIFSEVSTYPYGTVSQALAGFAN